MVWVVARAKPGAMELATTNLKRQEFKYYAPRYRVTVTRHRKPYELIRYLFSNYLFIETQDRWMAINNTFGISSILLFGGAPEPVSAKVIEDLMSRDDDNGFYQFPKDPESEFKFKPGQKLSAIGGAFNTFFCVCEHHTSAERVQVLFSLFGRSTRVEMDVTDLVAV